MFGIFKGKSKKSEAFGIDWSNVKEEMLTKIEVNQQDDESATPLMWAAKWCDSFWVFEKLINLGADVNPEDGRNKWHPLREMVQRDKLDIATLLIRNGASVKGLLYYVQSYKMFKVLMNNGATKGLTPGDKADVIGFLLAQRPRFGKDYGGYLTDKDMYSVTADLIGLGVDINAKIDYSVSNISLLHAASEYKHSDDVIDLLLDAGANVNAKDDEGETAFDNALRSRSARLIDKYIRCGAILEDYHALDAAENNDSGVFKILIDKGIDINYRFDGTNIDQDTYANKTTPLHQAIVTKNSPEVIKVLIEGGADVNALTDERLPQPPINLGLLAINPKNKFYATQVINTRLLIEAGASVFYEDFLGRLPVEMKSLTSELKEMLLNAQNNQTVMHPYDRAREIDIMLHSEEQHKEYFENGQLKVKGMIVNGNRDGLWTYWHKDGAVFMEQEYVSGRMIKELLF